MMSKPKVFLSYARPDQTTVQEIYDYLKSNGCNPWMDIVDIPVGSRWELVIQDAIEGCDRIIICLSKESVERVGFAQVEIKRAQKHAERYPETEDFIIPIRLDDCKPPHFLNDYSWLDWFDLPRRPKLIEALIGIAPQMPKLPSKLGDLWGLSTQELQLRLQLYQNEVNKPNPNADFLLAAGLVHLMLRSFGEAKSLLERFLQKQPTHAYGWYALTLAGLSGRRPRLLNYNEAKFLQTHVNNAVLYDGSQSHYFILLALIKDDYFKSKGFRIDNPDILSCLEIALEVKSTKEELAILLASITIPNSNLIGIIQKYFNVFV